MVPTENVSTANGAIVNGLAARRMWNFIFIDTKIQDIRAGWGSWTRIRTAHVLSQLTQVTNKDNE